MKDKIIHSKLIQWISGWKISKKLREHPFFSKFFNYEFISYLVVGVLTTVVNYVIFWICSYLLDVSTVPANTIAFIIAVTFAYVANKIFVFDSPSWKFRVIWKEFAAFIVSRLLYTHHLLLGNRDVVPLGHHRSSSLAEVPHEGDRQHFRHHCQLFHQPVQFQDCRQTRKEERERIRFFPRSGT